LKRLLTDQPGAENGRQVIPDLDFVLMVAGLLGPLAEAANGCSG
jgi:hypothetical protein